jgi:hypothetical protein
MPHPTVWRGTSLGWQRHAANFLPSPIIPSSYAFVLGVVLPILIILVGFVLLGTYGKDVQEKQKDPVLQYVYFLMTISLLVLPIGIGSAILLGLD